MKSLPPTTHTHPPTDPHPHIPSLPSLFSPNATTPTPTPAPSLPPFINQRTPVWEGEESRGESRGRVQEGDRTRSTQEGREGEGWGRD
jgi:hypothetical protein